MRRSVVPASPGTCLGIFGSPRLLPSHEVPLASLTRLALKSNAQGKLTLKGVEEEGTDLLNFPGLLSPPFPSGLGTKAGAFDL